MSQLDGKITLITAGSLAIARLFVAEDAGIDLRADGGMVLL